MCLSEIRILVYSKPSFFFFFFSPVFASIKLSVNLQLLCSSSSQFVVCSCDLQEGSRESKPVVGNLKFTTRKSAAQ